MSFYKFLLIVSISFLISISFYNAANAALILQSPKYIGLNSGLVGYWSFNAPDLN